MPRRPTGKRKPGNTPHAPATDTPKASKAVGVPGLPPAAEPAPIAHNAPVGLGGDFRDRAERFRDEEGTRRRLVWTHGETARQVQIIETLMAQGVVAVHHIKQVLSSQKLGCGEPRIKLLMGRVRERWAKEDQEHRVAWKSAQVRRLQNHIRDMKAGEKVQWGAVVQAESLLADIQGTKEPIQVQHDVRQTEAMMAVIGTLPAEEMLAILDAHERTLVLAEKAKEHGLDRALPPAFGMA